MKYDIYFCSKRFEGNEATSNVIQIYPKFSNWNDFGHQSQFLFYIAGEESAREFRFAFVEEAADDSDSMEAGTIFRKKFESVGKSMLPASDFPEFYSMFYEIDDYRNLVSTFGVEKANDILIALNDVVYLRQNKLLPAWLPKALNSRIFNLSFLRNSEGIFAFYNAGSVLSGIEYENLSAVEEDIFLEFQLQNFDNPHKFHFKFNLNSFVPKKIAVIIGKNGVGKSRSLYHIADAALNKKGNLTNLIGKRPSLNKIIAISTPGETQGTFPVAPREPAIKYERLLSEHGAGADALGRTLPEIFIQLAKIWDRQIGKESRWEIFEELISGFLPISEIAIAPPLGLDQDEGTPVRLERLVRGGEQKTLEAMQLMHKNGVLVRRTDEGVFPLSSGQVSFIRLSAQLSLTVENASLILIDEPETHLHPNLITEFVGMLNKILDLTGSIAIMATHSAYLVREVPRSQVHVIQESNRIIDITIPRLKTFGADVGAISEFVFGDDIVNRLVKDVERQIKKRPSLRNSWKEELKSELSSEAIMYLTDALETPTVEDDSEL